MLTRSHHILVSVHWLNENVKHAHDTGRNLSSGTEVSGPGTGDSVGSQIEAEMTKLSDGKTYPTFLLLDVNQWYYIGLVCSIFVLELVFWTSNAFYRKSLKRSFSKDASFCRKLCLVLIFMFQLATLLVVAILGNTDAKMGSLDPKFAYSIGLSILFVVLSIRLSIRKILENEPVE